MWSTLLVLVLGCSGADGRTLGLQDLRPPRTREPLAIVTPTYVGFSPHSNATSPLALVGLFAQQSLTTLSHYNTGDRLLVLRVNESTGLAVLWDVGAAADHPTSRMELQLPPADSTFDEPCLATDQHAPQPNVRRSLDEADQAREDEYCVGLVFVTSRLVEKAGSVDRARHWAMAAALIAGDLARAAHLSEPQLAYRWAGVLPAPPAYDASVALDAVARESLVHAAGADHCVRLVYDNRVYRDHVIGEAYVGGACSVGRAYAALLVSPNDGWASLALAAAVTLHELLHAMGARHQASPGNIMSPILDPRYAAIVLNNARQDVEAFVQRYDRACLVPRPVFWHSHGRMARPTPDNKSVARATLIALLLLTGAFVLGPQTTRYTAP